MSSPLDPFGPWRPPEPRPPARDPDPDPFEPWRPEGYTPPEPAEPRDRPTFTERPSPPGPPRPRPTSPLLRPDQAELLFLLSALGIAFGVVMSNLSASHLTRVGGAALALGLGFALSLTLLRRRRWFVRVGWLLGGVTGAVLAWWFVPTTKGISLWSAQRRVAEFEAVAPCDYDAYHEASPAARQLALDFPACEGDVTRIQENWGRASLERELKGLGEVPVSDLDEYRKSAARLARLAGEAPSLPASIRRAERDWGRRSLEALAAQFRELPAGDLAAYKEQEPRYREALGLFPESASIVEDAERDWLGRTADRRLAEADALRKRDPAAAGALLRRAMEELAPLRHYEAVKPRLLAGRKQALVARLEAAWLEQVALLKQDRYPEMAAVVERLRDAELDREAEAVGAAGELRTYRDKCAFPVDLARLAGKLGPDR